MTPGAPYRRELFPTYSDKFTFIQNPSDEHDHVKIIQENDPDIVVTNTVGNDLLDYPILQASKTLGIKTLTFIASWDNVWKIERMVKKAQNVCVPDHIIVWNEMMKDHLREIFRDLEQDRIRVIGAPRLDYFSHNDKIPSKKDTYRLLGFEDTSRPMFHFATTELYPMDYILEIVISAVKKGWIKANPCMYASVHPGGNMEHHKRLIELGATVRYSFGRSHNAIIPEFAYNPTEQDVYNLVGVFTNASLLINHSSTVALESLISGVPVINVQYGKSGDWIRWYRSMVYRDFHQHYKDLISNGATYVVRNRNEFIKAINEALEHPKEKEVAKRETVKKMITTTDGTAGQKVLDVIKEQAKINTR